MTLFEVLDALAAVGITYDLDHSATSPVLVFEPELLDDADAAVRAVEPWLTLTALGRYTGHAPGSCDSCGELALIAIVNSSGTSRWAPSVGWPRCRITPRCRGRVVVREAERFGVRRVKPPGVPQLKRWALAHGRLDLVALIEADGRGQRTTADDVPEDAPA